MYCIREGSQLGFSADIPLTHFSHIVVGCTILILLFFSLSSKESQWIKSIMYRLNFSTFKPLRVESIRDILCNNKKKTFSYMSSIYLKTQTNQELCSYLNNCRVRSIIFTQHQFTRMVIRV
jgi:hypothetical protein